MTKKEMGMLAGSGVVLLVAGYFMYVLLFADSSTKTNVNNNNQSTDSTPITGEFDADTLKTLKNYKDYGSSSQTNIGRVNPFGPIN